MKLVSILPADSYVVINKSLLNDNDRLVLTMLYQPIIGSVALSLYFTLWSDLNKTEIMSNEYTHHHLMNVMGLKLDEIVSARKRIEAVGLLKTMFKIGQVNNYVYEIYSPLSAMEFFSNPILASSLLSSIGKKEYQDLINYYRIPKINTSDFEDITSHFSDIYMMGTKDLEEVLAKNIKSKDKLEVIIDDVVDFDYIISSMPKGIVNEKAFTGTTRKLINRLAYLYNFDDSIMISLIKNSINEKGMISDAELKKNCKNYYSFENENIPKLIYRSKGDIKVETKDTKNIKDKLIECFEKTSPYDFLKARYGGAKPTTRDVNLIESLLVDQELNPGVVNVLIDYVLRINDKKLNKNFVQAIASQWKLSKIETVFDAMKQAEKEYRKMNQVKEKSKKEEKLPTWYGKDVKKKEMTDEEVKELESMLSEFV
ncbi:MAG: DnaD domain protein [Bacilli bacterium]|nr:DnaD domain protein [Bacilli bacterium]